jgi:hypothetical protein
MVQKTFIAATGFREAFLVLVERLFVVEVHLI